MPSSPFQIGFLSGITHYVHVVGDYAYLTGALIDFRIVDITYPDTPTVVGSYDADGDARGVCTEGTYAYVADFKRGLCVIDISNPANPVEAGIFETGNGAQNVCVSEGYIYVADGYDGFYVLYNDLLTGLMEKPLRPELFSLEQNYPNPFNPSTLIAYHVPLKGGSVTIQVFDAAGRLVKTLVNGYKTSGRKIVAWDGTNNQGKQMASGVYFCRMTAKGYEKTIKMIYLK